MGLVGSFLDFVGKAEFLSQFLEFFPGLGEVLLLSHVFIVVDGLEAQQELVFHVIIEGKHVSVDQLKEVVQMSGFFGVLDEFSEDLFPVLGHRCLEERISSIQFAFFFKYSPDLASIVLPVVRFLNVLWDLYACDLSIVFLKELRNLLMRYVVLGDLPVGILRLKSNFRDWGLCIGAAIFWEVMRDLFSSVLCQGINLLRLFDLKARVAQFGCFEEIALDEVLPGSAYDSDVDASSTCVKGLAVTLPSISLEAGRAESAYLWSKYLHIKSLYLFVSWLVIFGYNATTLGRETGGLERQIFWGFRQGRGGEEQAEVIRGLFGILMI